MNTEHNNPPADDVREELPRSTCYHGGTCDVADGNCVNCGRISSRIDPVELILDARDLARVSREIDHGAPSHADMIDDLADALEDALLSPPADDVREALAREIYRQLYPGSIDTPDSMRSAESDAKERDRAYRTWDRGREGYAPGAICRDQADAIRAAFEVRPYGTVTDTEEEVSPSEEIAAKVQAARGTSTPTPEEVDAAAQSLSSLSDEEWAAARDQEHVRYYVVSARLALEAAYAARDEWLAHQDAEVRDALTPRPAGPCPERYPDPADDVQCWLTAGHEGEHIVDGGTYRWSTPTAALLPAPGTAVRPYGTVTPTPDEWSAQMDAERARQIEHGYDDAHDAEHGAAHLLNWAIDYARRGNNLAAATMARCALRLPYGTVTEQREWVCAKCGGSALDHSLATSACVWEPEWRGTVADAEVEAAARAIYEERGGEWNWDSLAVSFQESYFSDARAALEAAREARS